MDKKPSLETNSSDESGNNSSLSSSLPYVQNLQQQLLHQQQQQQQLMRNSLLSRGATPGVQVVPPPSPMSNDEHQGSGVGSPQNNITQFTNVNPGSPSSSLGDGDDDDDTAPVTEKKGKKKDSKKSVKRGRRKIKIEYVKDKSKRHITFSKRKGGIMKKAYELTTLTGTQALLLVASETGHVYTFATPKLQPLITKPEGKNLIQACLNAPDPPQDEDTKEQINIKQEISTAPNQMLQQHQFHQHMQPQSSRVQSPPQNQTQMMYSGGSPMQQQGNPNLMGQRMNRITIRNNNSYQQQQQQQQQQTQPQQQYQQRFNINMNSNSVQQRYSPIGNGQGRLNLKNNNNNGQNSNLF